MIEWKKHPTSGMWEARAGNMRARVKPTLSHAADFLWGVITCDPTREDFADLKPKEYRELIVGDTLGDDAEEIAKTRAMDALMFRPRTR